MGTAPALASLADTEEEPVSTRLRAEAARLVRLLGVPTWLVAHLGAVPPPSPAT